jgi:hypothetical protein
VVSRIVTSDFLMSKVCGYLRVVLDPLGSGNELSAEVRTDGTFTIGPVSPGHWRLSVAGVYIKSVTQGERKVSAADIEIGAQAGPPLKIVAGTNFATLRVTTSGQPPSTERILVFIGIDGGPDGPMFPVSQDGSDMVSGGGISVPPGRHLVCAFVGFQPWMTPRSSLDFRELRPALESHCQTVQASEGGEITNLASFRFGDQYLTSKSRCCSLARDVADPSRCEISSAPNSRADRSGDQPVPMRASISVKARIGAELV